MRLPIVIPSYLLSLVLSPVSSGMIPPELLLGALVTLARERASRSYLVGAMLVLLIISREEQCDHRRELLLLPTTPPPPPPPSYSVLVTC